MSLLLEVKHIPHYLCFAVLQLIYLAQSFWSLLQRTSLVNRRPVPNMDGKIDGGIELSNIGTKQKSDDNDLARLGKTPVLKALIPSICVFWPNKFLQRNFGFMSILGFSCTVLITWEGLLM